MTSSPQVLIVGGGPVGVALAVDLGQRGVSCCLVEQYREPQRIPKGQNLTERTLEHFYFWGIEDAVRKARLMPPGTGIGTVVVYESLAGEYWYTPPPVTGDRDFFYTANERLPQYLTEEALRARMAALPSVEARFGWQCVSVEQDATRVRIRIEEKDGPGEDVLEADYLVGCDGSRSLVRESAGIDRSGEDFGKLMVLAVFRSKDLHEHLARFPERSTYNVMHPDLEGFWQFFGRIDVGEGFFFHSPIPPDTDRDSFDFHAHLEKVAGFSFEADYDYVGFWDNRIAVAEEYRSGRIFIAGDAAHSHPPYGGFGLNNGIEDAANLGWKLAARLAGWGTGDLLASYDEERRPVFKETGEDFIAARIEADRRFLAEHSPDKDKDDFAKAWEGRTMAAFRQRRQAYEPNYEGSPVICGPEGGVCSAHGTHQVKARPGHHLAPMPLSSGENVYEELGPDFTLLAFGAANEAIDAFSSAAVERHIPLKIVADDAGGDRSAYEARLILVRPDQYVVWTGNAAPADAGAILDRASGR